MAPAGKERMGSVPSPMDFHELSLVMEHNILRASAGSVRPPSPSAAPSSSVLPLAEEAAQEASAPPPPPQPSASAPPRSSPPPIASSLHSAGAASISVALTSAMAKLASTSLAVPSQAAAARGTAPERVSVPLKLRSPAPPVRAPAKRQVASMSSAGAPLQPVAVLAPAKLRPPPQKCLSAFPDYQMLRSPGHGDTDPAGVPAARKAALVWFRNDLRVHDNEALAMASSEATTVLPVYCFDPRDYGKSSSGFDKTGPYRAKFLLECVGDLRKNLRAKGSDLIVRVGKPEEVIPDLAKKVCAVTVYAHQEVTHEELVMEEKVCSALKAVNVATKLFWGSTLYHVDDLPFKLADVPSNYGGFREKVQNLRVRAVVAAPGALKAVPTLGGVAVGEIPTLQQLGLSPLAGAKEPASASFRGGESEALQRLKAFITETKAMKGSSGDGTNGANFSCKISPWLALGCLSPRKMYDDLKKSAGVRQITAAASKAGESAGLNWLIFELLWRDFFRFITKKYGASRLGKTAAPASAQSAAVLTAAV